VTGDELRQAFLSFFHDRGHKIIPSSSLVPHKDPTLLLTSAGMVQIKPYFLGLETPPSRRLASCQKCFRTTDIDSVGDSKHLTFFEMLGNFSVGDYFKKEAISWAWEFVTEYLKLPEERLWITVYLDDDEAFAYWREIGIPAGKILRFGEEDNFWGPVGDAGPCGPCSEIHYDLGEGFGCGRPDCRPSCDCGRFSEIWNLVFTQYNQDQSGQRSPLPKPNIDTGMGLERTLAAIQGKSSPYETALFSPLIDRICQLSGERYGRDEDTDRAIRIVAEHSRGIAFLIADGVKLSNEGRGYVLRRILRRASVFGKKLGLNDPFLNEMTDVVANTMSHIYPELVANQRLINEIVRAEEENFITTLDSGLNSINATFQQIAEQVGKTVQPIQEALQQMGETVQPIQEALRQMVKAVQPIQESLGQAAEQIDKAIQVQAGILNPENLKALQEVQKAIQQIPKIATISGKEVFKLHDTFGFPKELTAEIAREKGLSIDWEGFQAEMEKQRERARARRVVVKPRPAEAVGTTHGPKVVISFVGYRKYGSRAKVLQLVANEGSVRSVAEGSEVDVMLNKTPFYGEMGGQVGDSGEISSQKGKVAITNTLRTPSDAIIHRGKVVEGSISVGDEVEAKVDVSRRLDIARNHTATHLLQAALRQIVDRRIEQKGSLVEPERFRFDFSHLGQVTEEQLNEIQRQVNEWIRQDLRAEARVVPYKQAIAEGAIALFEEKYGEEVRMLEIGKPAISKELCGGTHVSSTGEIGVLLITSESSIGTGLHRIEAVTGREAESLIESRLSDLQSIAKEVEGSLDEVPNKVKTLISELEAERKRVLSLERELSHRIVEDLPGQAEQVSGVTILAAKVPALTMPILREMGDILRDRLKSSIVVLATVYNGKPNFLAMVTPDLIAKGFNAGDIINQVARVTGGGGGGKAAIAQAGGKDADKVDEALKKVGSVIASKISISSDGKD
jgi:alanyl-tRNA synthetase